MATVRFETELEDGPPLVPMRLDVLAPDGARVGSYGGMWDRHRKDWTDDPCGAVELRLHPGQLPAARWFAGWRATAPRARDVFTCVLWGGRAGGKTVVGLTMLASYALSYRNAICWVVCQTQLAGEECRRELEEKLLPTGSYTKREIGHDELQYRLRNGTLIRMRSGARPGALKSGRVDCAFLNEGAELAQICYDNVRPRVADRAGLVIIATNPATKERGRWVERYRDAVMHDERAAVSFNMAVDDNPHISMAAVNARQQELSHEDWEKERFGISGPIGDAALTSWRRSTNFVDVPAHYVNVTAEVTRRIYGRALPYVVGFDFQIHPYCAAVVQTYWQDPNLPQKWPDIWLSDFVTGADEHETLRELEDLGYDGAGCVAVPDWSATWQDAAHNTRAVPSARILSGAGWRYIHPPAAGAKANPDVVARCRAFNALLRNAAGRSTLHVARDMSIVADALERLPRKHGKPDGRSQYSHIYDSAAYPAFRFYQSYVVSSEREHKDPGPPAAPQVAPPRAERSRGDTRPG